MQTKRILQNCGEDDHTWNKTNKCQNESKCANCGEGRMAGTSNCEVDAR